MLILFSSEFAQISETCGVHLLLGLDVALEVARGERGHLRLAVGEAPHGNALTERPRPVEVVLGGAEYLRS